MTARDCDPRTAAPLAAELMFILLAAALVGDLVLLPAMLATRLDKYFEPIVWAGGARS